MRKTLLALSMMLLAGIIAAPANAESTCHVQSDIGKKLSIPVYEWVNRDVPNKGTIVAVHGLTFYAAAYDNMASHLADQGYRFLAADMRGFGRWRDEYNKFGGDNEIHFTDSKDDVVRILQAVRQENPDQKLICMGESLGANMALWVAEEHPELIDGIILSAPCYKTRMHPKPRWIIDIAKGLKNPNKKLDLTAYITPYLSDNKALTVECLKDKRICRSLSPVELIKAEKTNRNAMLALESIPSGMPILIVAGKKDAVMNQATLPEMVGKLKTKDVSVNVLPDRGHLLLEHQSVNPEVAQIVDNWLVHQTTQDQVVQLP